MRKNSSNNWFCFLFNLNRVYTSRVRCSFILIDAANRQNKTIFKPVYGRDAHSPISRLQNKLFLSMQFETVLLVLWRFGIFVCLIHIYGIETKMSTTLVCTHWALSICTFKQRLLFIPILSRTFFVWYMSFFQLNAFCTLFESSIKKE